MSNPPEEMYYPESRVEESSQVSPDGPSSQQNLLLELVEHSVETSSDPVNQENVARPSSLISWSAEPDSSEPDVQGTEDSHNALLRRPKFTPLRLPIGLYEP